MLSRIGKYTIDSEIGRGGFGQVYRAFDPAVGRAVAIKVLKPEADQSLITRFRNEAVAAGNLQHKNIVTVFEFGEQDGQAYLVMEYLQGRDLQHVLQEETPLTLLQKVQIMSQVADGLHCAHLHGVVHRDVKPANIMVLPDGTAKVMDFGIARLLYSKGATQTQAGFMIGSLLYMSPEQFGAGPIDSLCDIWGYGVIYYELITGRHPFSASEPAAAMYQIQKIDPPPIHQIVPDCPQLLADIVTRALAKDRELRYQTLEDVRIDAEPLLQQLQREEADVLARTAQELAERNDWDAVQSTVKQILDLDSSNQIARQLREAMRQRSKRQSIRPRVETLLKQGMEQLTARQFRAAIEAFESALRLDESDLSIRSRLFEANNKLEQSKKAAELLRSARHELDARNFTSAQERAAEALRIDPENRDALATLSAVRTEAQRRESELAIQQALQKAKGLVLLQDFDEALSVLNTLKVRVQTTATVEQAISDIEQHKLEHERRQHLRAHLEQGKDLLKRGAFGDAAARLQTAQVDFPDDRELQQLLSYAEQQLENQRRFEALERVRTEAQRLIGAQEYDSALQGIEIALKANPDDAGLTELLQSALNGKAAHKRETAVLTAIRNAEIMARQNRMQEALEIVSNAASEFPDDTRLSGLCERLSERLRQTERSAAIRKAITEAQDLIRTKEPDRAVALLQSGIARFPDAEELRKALETARRDRAEQDEQRAVIAALERSRRLEQEEQWAAAFGVVTAALGSYPDSETLRAAAARLQQRMAEEDRRYALNRERAEIEQLIAARHYADALDRLYCARDDFADESIERLSKRVQSLIVEESDQYASRIRSALQVGDLDQADDLLLEGLRVLPSENALLPFKSEIADQRQCRELTITARTQLDKGDYDSAERSIKEALKIRSDDPSANEVRRELEHRRAELDRKRRIEHARKSARELLAKKRFNDARKFLNTAIKNFPDALEFHIDLAEVDAAQKAHDEQEDREAQIARLLRLQKTGDAQQVLNEARQILAAAPAEARARELVAWAEQAIAQAKQEREQSIAKARTTAQAHVEASRFSEARASLNALLKRYPDATELRDDLAKVDEAEQRRREQDKRNAQITVLYDLKNAGNAKQVLAGATQLLQAVPDESRARDLAGWAQQALAEEQARLAREKLERERQDRERLEREKAERDRLERERVERERLEREAAEREKTERARLEREQAERERRDREKADRARIESEKLQLARKKAAAAAPQGGTLVSDSQEFPQPATGSHPVVEEISQPVASPRRSRTWMAVAAAGVLVIGSATAWIIGHRPGGVSPLEVDIATINETTPANTAVHKTLNIRSANPRPFAVAPTADWLHVSSSGGQTPAVLEIDLDPAKLAAGKSYIAAIELRNADGAVERSIPVHLSIPKPIEPPPLPPPTTPGTPPPVLSVSVSDLRFECEAFSTPTEIKHVAVSTSGSPHAFQAREQPPSTWISINPRAGNTPATLAVAVDAKTLREGNYSASILVQAGPDRESTKTVRVNLVVRPAAKKGGPVTPPPPQPAGNPTPAQPTQIEPPKINPAPPGPAPNPTNPTTPSRPYGGAARGRFFWSGTLGPNEQIVFTPDGVQGAGIFQGNKLPGGVSVDITTNPPDLVKKEVPSPANGYNRLVLANPGSTPVKSIEVRWNLK